MPHETTTAAVATTLSLIGFLVGLSLLISRRVRSAGGYYAADGRVHWLVNGFALAGVFLPATLFLNICGGIAAHGDWAVPAAMLGGWFVALFFVAGPVRRWGGHTLGDALNHGFNIRGTCPEQGRGVRASVALATLVVCLLFLVPVMVGAGQLAGPLLGMDHLAGVALVGGAALLIVAAAGMPSTTWSQFLPGVGLLVLCIVLTVMVLNRGFVEGGDRVKDGGVRIVTMDELRENRTIVEENEFWRNKPYVRTINTTNPFHPDIWRVLPDGRLGETQQKRITTDKQGNRLTYLNGYATNDPDTPGKLYPFGSVLKLPNRAKETGPVGPRDFLNRFYDSRIVRWCADVVHEGPTVETTIYHPKIASGYELLFMDHRWSADALSLFLALLCGTACLPHLLIRHFTVRDAKSARKSVAMGMVVTLLIFVSLLYIGIGALINGALDPDQPELSLTNLARLYGGWTYAAMIATLFTAAVGTVAGVILAAGGAIAHDLMGQGPSNDDAAVKRGKLAAVCVGLAAIGLGVVFHNVEAGALIAWPFAVAASTFLPAILMLRFWKRTTKQAVVAAITISLLASLAWVLLSGGAYEQLYGLDPADSMLPFNSPALVTVPLSFVVLVVVSLATRRAAPNA